MPALLQDWLANHAAYEAAGRKLAIYIGPGGNAGVIGAGMVCAMMQTRSLLPNALYIGGSVGAFDWMLLGQGPLPATAFGSYFCDHRYFSPRRLFKGKPPISLDFILDHVFEKHIPFDYTTSENTTYQVHALTTGPQGEPKFLPLTGTGKVQIQYALRHSAAMPILARMHDVHSMEGWDAYLAEPELLHHLRLHGVTDVVWILNRPLVEEISVMERLMWKYVISKTRKSNPMLSGLIRQRLELGDFLQTPPAGLQLEVIQPPLLLSALTQNPRKIFHALGASYRWMGNYLGHPSLPYPEEWAPYLHHMPG